MKGTWLAAIFSSAILVTAASNMVRCGSTPEPTKHSFESMISCASCHFDLYQTSKQPNHPKLSVPTDCKDCHTSESWHPAPFPMHDEVFALDGVHKTLACESCHKDRVYDPTPADCYGCHQAAYEHADDPNHVKLGYPKTCPVCHTTKSWEPATFQGHDKYWPLTGQHSVTPCGACHVNNVYEGTPQDCYSCHKADFEGTDDPNHVASAFPTTCDTCHTTKAWEPATLDHDEFWPLTGKHEQTACTSCHVGETYKGTPTACYGCHKNDFEATDDPDHVAGGFSTTCETCHSTNGWKPANIDHDAFWPLTGKHKTADCSDCHTSASYADAPKECFGCHKPDYDGAKSPDHAKEKFPTTCETCHTTMEWEPSIFDHEAVWPLTGKHSTADCSSCHENGQFAGTNDTCYGCHKANYDGTEDPNHIAEGIPTSCDACHSTNAWEPASFEGHDAYWPLTGKHATADCASCHANGYEGTPKECIGCHKTNYDGTTDPNHAAEGYPTTCQICHTTTAWEPASFEGHDDYWPLTGKHATAKCGDCHENGVYAGTPKDCYSCHETEYQGTADPNHVAEQFPTTCNVCHTTQAWEPASFAGHDAYWPLTGKHKTAECAACHAGGVYKNTPKDCYACHKTHYDGTTDPNHKVEGFPTTCEICHQTTAWEPASYAGHDAYWPLTGKHSTAKCSACHEGGVYQGTPDQCYACHKPDYDGTTDPNHKADGFPTTCEVCHTTGAWEPATFTGHDAYWPLTGKHATTACADCHKGGVYSGTTKTCSGCHTPDYNASTNPSHTKLGMSKTCDTCHSTTSWATLKFPGHDPLFPITSGKHKKGCKECHKTSSWAVFQCIDCHKLSEMNSKHQGEVGNYQSTLNSQPTIDHGCLHCHPKGTEDD